MNETIDKIFQGYNSQLEALAKIGKLNVFEVKGLRQDFAEFLTQFKQTDIKPVKVPHKTKKVPIQAGRHQTPKGAAQD